MSVKYKLVKRKALLPAALSTEAAFHMNPTVILTQTAFESGWGTSRLATEALNFFGLTAYGCSNQYWHGDRTSIKGRYGELYFRCLLLRILKHGISLYLKLSIKFRCRIR